MPMTGITVKTVGSFDLAIARGGTALSRLSPFSVALVIRGLVIRLVYRSPE
jgi:hypothetical protein